MNDHCERYDGGIQFPRIDKPMAVSASSQSPQNAFQVLGAVRHLPNIIRDRKSHLSATTGNYCCIIALISYRHPPQFFVLTPKSL